MRKYPNNRILVLTTVALLFSCTKFDPERVNKVSTGSASSITQASGTIEGNVLEKGDKGIDQHGFYYATHSDPTSGNYEKTELGSNNSSGSFNENITGLEQGTSYYYRAYVKSSDGEVFGDVMSFATLAATVPSVFTTEITGISQTSAVSGGTVTDGGGTTVTTRGVCWSTSENPTITDSRSTDGNGAGEYTSSISGLSCGTTYYVRAYATNVTGTAYGNQDTFITSDCTSDPPTVSTALVTSITETTALGGGNVINDGGSIVTVKGVCWSTSVNPTISDSKTNDGNGTGSFTSSITGLTCGTTYYVRAYATNSSGTSYGNEVEFSSTVCPTGLPIVTTTSISNILETTAMSGGSVSNDGGTSVTTKGVCWSISQNPTIADNSTSDGSGTGGFTSAISGLSCGTTYYVRAYATNANGTSYGTQESFTTSDCQANLATLTTISVTNISETSAQSGGSVSDDGGATVTAKGVVWSTSQNPALSDSKTTDGNGTGGFTSLMDGLSCGTTYYVRAYATNSEGTAYGNQVSFKTSTVIDYDGNIYRTVVIGSQTWMAENLKTIHFNNGNSISNETNTADWNNLLTPGYCWYDNSESSYKDTYGAIYNNYAVESGSLCPSGWHVPTDDEWKTLEMYIGMSQAEADELNWRGTDEGNKLKATYGWNSGGNGNDDYGFSGLPGGYRGTSGEFSGIGDGGLWWTSTAYSSDRAYYRTLGFDKSGIERYHLPKYLGWSVRCVKN